MRFNGNNVIEFRHLAKRKPLQKRGALVLLLVFLLLYLLINGGLIAIGLAAK